MRRLNLRENPFGDEGRWAIGDELVKKKKKWKSKQKEKKIYEGQDYKPPTQREKVSRGGGDDPRSPDVTHCKYLPTTSDGR